MLDVFLGSQRDRSNVSLLYSCQSAKETKKEGPRPRLCVFCHESGSAVWQTKVFSSLVCSLWKLGQESSVWCWMSCLDVHARCVLLQLPWVSQTCCHQFWSLRKWISFLRSFLFLFDIAHLSSWSRVIYFPRDHELLGVTCVCIRLAVSMYSTAKLMSSLASSLFYVKHQSATNGKWQRTGRVQNCMRADCFRKIHNAVDCEHDWAE